MSNAHTPGRFLVFNIGCIECGVSSGVVGVFPSLDLAGRVASACHARLHWREGGQNEFEVFDLDAPQSEEYADAIAKATGERA